ncbi:hypothetical protein ACH50O_13945 [Methylomonas sp. 2BW1-5-20]|uniref:hypothetical protein n=1 Tax=Methylomonas sp. 2BW1-5-20 TaxID=3376686 RepID=UPI004052B4EE
MKKMTAIGLVMIFTSGTVMADGFRLVYGYDRVDAMADREIYAIDAQEQADVMHELREGDYREAQQIIQQDEAIKDEIRREEAMYDAARDMNRFNAGYGGYYDYSGW